MMETVKVKKDNAAGYAIINKSDFDPARHALFDAPKKVPEPKPVKKARK